MNFVPVATSRGKTSGQSSMQNRKCHQEVVAFDSRYCRPLTNMENNDQAVCLFVSDLTSAATAPSPFPSLQNWGTTWLLTPVTGLSSAATVAVPLPGPPPSTTTSGPTLEKSPSSKWWLTFHPIFLLAFRTAADKADRCCPAQPVAGEGYLEGQCKRTYLFSGYCLQNEVRKPIHWSSLKLFNLGHETNFLGLFSHQ